MTAFSSGRTVPNAVQVIALGVAVKSINVIDKKQEENNILKMFMLICKLYKIGKNNLEMVYFDSINSF